MKISILKKKRGFTLIELLVVIAIIGILTGIIIPNMTGAKAKARDAKRVTDLGQIQQALELYFDRCKQYPSTQPVLDVNDHNGCPVTTPQIMLGTFLTKVPTPPPPIVNSESNYEYDWLDADGNGLPDTYLLRVTLESNNPALQDDIDTAPQSWTNNPNLGDIGTICEDAAAPYQYCLVSN